MSRKTLSLTARKLLLHLRRTPLKNTKIIKEAKTTIYKFLSQVGNTAFEVYKDKVAIFLWGSPNHLILIENKEVANSYRNQFNILWEQAKSNKSSHR